MMVMGSDKVRAILPAGVDKALEVVGASTVVDTMKAIRPWVKSL